MEKWNQTPNATRTNSLTMAMTNDSAAMAHQRDTGSSPSESGKPRRGRCRNAREGGSSSARRALKDHLPPERAPADSSCSGSTGPLPQRNAQRVARSDTHPLPSYQSFALPIPAVRHFVLRRSDKFLVVGENRLVGSAPPRLGFPMLPAPMLQSVLAALGHSRM